MLVPLGGEVAPAPPQQLGTVVDHVLREAIFGLALGLGMNLVYQSLHMASRIVGVQVGFGLGGVFDPLTGSESGVFDRFYFVLVALVFFAVNGHYLVISALAETVQAVPLGTFDPFTAIQPQVLGSFFLGLVVTAVRIAMPIMAALFLVDLGMGFVAKTAPQIQILIVALPVKIGVGLIVLMAALPATTQIMNTVISGPLTGSSQQLLGVR
ncbi:MAG: flagellar biosynthetic protein FliR [Dehalococcoidia bacterium]|nr:flagellar biosynthetic protein FliR [Dehalococcoidia bacterium]